MQHYTLQCCSNQFEKQALIKKNHSNPLHNFTTSLLYEYIFISINNLQERLKSFSLYSKYVSKTAKSSQSLSSINSGLTFFFFSCDVTDEVETFYLSEGFLNLADGWVSFVECLKSQKIDLNAVKSLIDQNP